MIILDILGSLFPAIWSMFGLEYPGLGVSFGTVLLAIIIIRISIALINGGLGVGGNGTNYRSGSTRNPKISKERKDDTF